MYGFNGVFMLTRLGKFLDNLCTNAGITQKQLATAIGCSAGTLSNYMNGKTVPEFDLLAKCVDLFDIEGKYLKAFFTCTFASTVKSNQKIVIDTRYFQEERLDLLVKVLVFLLLFSEKNIVKYPSGLDSFYRLRDKIRECFQSPGESTNWELEKPIIIDNSDK